MAAFMKNAASVAAGPLMVIETDVLGLARLKPEYSFLASSRQAMLTPALPILP